MNTEQAPERKAETDRKTPEINTYDPTKPMADCEWEPWGVKRPLLTHPKGENDLHWAW